MIEVICIECKKKFKIYPYRLKHNTRFCSYTCRNKNFKGTKSFNWRGGKQKHSGGYIVIKKNNKRMLEHRFIIENHIGRKLKNNERVHHINGIKDDNRIENLILFTSESDHQKHHWNLKKDKHKV